MLFDENGIEYQVSYDADENRISLQIVRSSKNTRFIRESVSLINKSCFYGNELISSIVIPSSVERIVDKAFAFCSNLVKIKFDEPSRLKVIHQYAFYCCKAKKIIFPSSLEFIGYQAFYGSNLHSIIFRQDSNLKIINVKAFERSNLEIVDFPSSLEVIERYAFLSCKKLRKISFQDDSEINTIAENSFYSTGIESVVCTEFSSARFVIERHAHLSSIISINI